MRPLEGKKIVVASHNEGKLREFADLMAPFGLEAKSAKEFGLPEPDETGTTFEENAYIKAFAAAKRDRPAGAVRRFRSRASTRSTARRASTPRTGRKRPTARATSALRCSGPRWPCSEIGAVDAGAAHRPFRGGDLPGMAGRRCRIFSRRGRGHSGLAAARRQRLRLRPGVSAGRLRAALSAR